MTIPILSMRSEIRALPRGAWILYAETLVNRLGTFVLVFLVLWLTRIGWSAGMAGLAVSVYGLGGLFASLAGGWLADRFGRRRTIALSMFSSAAVLLSLPHARGTSAVLMLAGLAGLTSELYRPAANGLLSDLIPAGRRVPGFAIYRLAVNLGHAVGPAIGGFVAERSFVWVFTADAATSIVAGIVALTLLPEGRRSTREEDPMGGFRGALVADRSFLVFLAANIVVTLIAFQSTASFPLQVRASGLTSVHYGLLMSLNGLLVVLFELPLVGITRRHRPRPVMAVGILLTGIGFGLVAWADTFAFFAMTVFVWTAGEIAFTPVAAAYVGDLAPDALRGRYYGAWLLTHSLGVVLGPGLGTALYAVSPGGLWGACAGLGLAGALLVLASPRPAERSTTISTP
ncbi:MAG TPA: MFS transporter [Gemmatimonadota bacterium]|nr:MFS transporter [Gemmatimonadota bacterium]